MSLWEDEQTGLPVIITDTACVCESEAGVFQAGENTAELMSIWIWKVTVWKPELQLNNVLRWYFTVFLVAKDVSETRGAF